MTSTSERKTYGVISTTRSAGAAAKLKNEGSRVVEFPAMFAPAGVDSMAVLPAIDNFDWTVFPDTFSAVYFVEALLNLGGNPAEMDPLQICSIGEATADRLRCFHVHTDLILQSPADALPAFSDYLGENGLRGLKFLLPQINGAVSELARALADAGAFVTELPVYQRAAGAKGDLPKLRALLAGGAIDEFVFCAPADLDNLLYICETNDIHAVLSGMKAAAATDQAAILLAGLGLIDFGFGIADFGF
jgi:uroporphyrinogen-III synthase